MATTTPEWGVANRMATANAEKLVPTKADATPTVNKQPQPVVSAQELASPPQTPVPPPIETPVPSTRAQDLVNNVSANTQQYLAAQSEEARNANEIAKYLGTQSFNGAEQRAQLGAEYGIPDNMRRLTDIQTQLARANTASNVQKAQIAGASGQTLAQGQRELTQQDKENAFRNAGLAAEASVLQGSIETATTLVSQAMGDYYQDRQMQNQNLIQQLDYYSGIADKQTAQLLENKKREYEADQKKIERVLDSVDTALASGYATAEDMRTLTNPKATDEQRLAVAQAVVSRGAGDARAQEDSDRALDRQIKQAQLNKLTAPETTGTDWGQRANIIKMASEGDPLAIASLGYDPRTKGLSPDKILESERNIAESTSTISMIDKMLGNSRGIGAITGQIKSPTLSGFFMGGKSDGSASSLVSKIPVIGNIQGAIQSRNDTDEILSDLQNLYNTEGFQEFIGLKQSGLTFGSLTEGERQSIFSAANRLNSALVMKTNANGEPSGRVEGYQGTADSLERDLREVQKGIKARNEEIATRLYLDTAEMQEIINL